MGEGAKRRQGERAETAIRCSRLGRAKNSARPGARQLYCVFAPVLSRAVDVVRSLYVTQRKGVAKDPGPSARQNLSPRLKTGANNQFQQAKSWARRVFRPTKWGYHADTPIRRIAVPPTRQTPNAKRQTPNAKRRTPNALLSPPLHAIRGE
jgi:hypothetical protein